MALELAAIAAGVMAAYYHVGKLSVEFFAASIIAMLVLGAVGVLFRDRIDLEGAD